MGPAPVRREVGYVAHDDDDHGSPFFLSYARTPEGPVGVGKAPGPDRHVEEFFHDLVENVSQLIPMRADVPAGFMDQGMRGGMRWTDVLLHAVGTCQVLIALLSARYLKSEWCRMEWHAFSQRAVLKLEGKEASPRQGCIVPVIWAPFHDTLPQHISPTLIFSPDRYPEPKAPDHYQKNGVFGLMRVGLLRESYEIVTWQLAMHIADILHGQRTESREFQLTELSMLSRSDGHGC